MSVSEDADTATFICSSFRPTLLDELNDSGNTADIEQGLSSVGIHK